MRKVISIALAILMSLQLCTFVQAASSPAWEAESPVAAIIDFSTIGKNLHWNAEIGWQPGGTYQSEYDFNTDSVKTEYDESNYLCFTKKADGVAGHRGDIRVKYYGAALAGDFDFMVDGTTSESNTAFKCNLNLMNKANNTIQGETTLLSVSGSSVSVNGGKGVAVTNNAWYRARMIINKIAKTVDVQVFQLEKDGTLGELVTETESAIALNTVNNTLGDDFLVNRYTYELYGAPGVKAAFDNYVFYDKEISTASFDVGAGGSVMIGENSITSESKGVASEIAVGMGEELKFAVQPSENYVLSSVTVDGVDKTADFSDGKEGSLGAVNDNTHIDVQFKTDSSSVSDVSASSPAWGIKSPVAAFTDFSVANVGWSIAGSYSKEYVYSTDGVKTEYDKSNYLSVTKAETGSVGHRGDIRVLCNAGTATVLAGDYDFMVDGTTAESNIAFKCNLNLMNKTDNTIQAETTLLSVSGSHVSVNGGKGVVVTNNAWYRARWTINKSDNTIDVEIFELEKDGTLGKLVTKTENSITINTNSGKIGNDFLVNRYTFELYGAPGVIAAIDNVVFYDKAVNTASFDVEVGGSVKLGESSITGECKGVASEVAVGKGGELKFAVQPSENYELKTVTVDGVDKTDEFAGGKEGSVGVISDNTRIRVQFKTKAPSFGASYFNNTNAFTDKEVVKNGETVKISATHSVTAYATIDEGYNNTITGYGIEFVKLGTNEDAPAKLMATGERYENQYAIMAFGAAVKAGTYRARAYVEYTDGDGVDNIAYGEWEEVTLN